MKTLVGFSIIIVFLVCLSTVNPAGAQEYSDEEICGFTDEEQEGFERSAQLGGRDITAEGTVRALILFIDFSDDDEDPDNENWPVGEGPAYIEDIIDPEEEGEVKQHNITSFLADNSFDQFIMIGDVIYSQALRSLSAYKNDPNTSSNVAHWAVWDILHSLDDEMDFADYDNWEKIANYQHEEEPDSVIDMIFVQFRRWYNDQSFWALGWASMPTKLNHNILYVDGGERWIDFNRSGVTSLAGYPQQKAFEICLHEFGHKWGLPHNYNDGMWTLMSYWQHTPSPFMNSYERERLGWITFVDITENTNATIPDFGTSGTPFRMQINANEYFLFENHQQESPFDVVNLYDPDLNSYEGPGLYILRLNDSNVEQKIKVVCADGNWNWDNPYWILNPFGTDSVPVYDRLDPNPVNGLSDKDRIPHTKNGTERVVAWLDDLTGVEKHAIRYKGIGLSRWIPDGSNVFSPWSNPPTTTANGDSTTLGIEVTGQSPSTGNINVKFYVTNPEDASPAAPMNLTAQPTCYQCEVELEWNANTEPDIDKYKIYRKEVTNGGGSSGYEYVASVNHPTTSFIDYESVTDVSNRTLYYKITAVDDDQNESAYSNEASIYAKIPRITLFGETHQIRELQLLNNFPNPFNPNTVIRFGLPQDQHISLKIYSIIGEEVGTLADGYVEKGYHELAWDGKNNAGKNVASGLYFYVLRAGDQMLVKKMMLVR